MPDPAVAQPVPSRTLGALRHRNYRLFLAGQIISTVGTWMQSVAMPWLALQLTHSGLLVGLVVAAQFVPVMLGSQFGGVVADRYHKRNVLLVTQALFTIPSFALFAVSTTGHAQYWMVVAAAIAAGTINLFDIPSRQAFLIEMVGRQDLMNAIALNSSVFNGAAVIGPATAGVLIAAVGVPICFLANSVSYLAAVVALLLMRDLPAVVRERREEPLLARIAQGASYAHSEPVVGMLLIAVAVFSLFAMNRQTLIPLFADQVLHVGAKGFGFLMGSMGLGALVGALTLAFSPTLGSDPRRQFWMAVIWVGALLEFSISRVFVISLATLFVAGYCQISFIATANNRIQTITPDGLRGRVMALYAQALIGVGPIGALQAGALASWRGAAWAMAIGAAVAGTVVVGIRFARPNVFTPGPRAISPAVGSAASRPGSSAGARRGTTRFRR
ncbi:MAG TPA: MFS transporter [Candidatus Dormibacteraeota bacterium]|nr:MFS transporter [Candidatus Dormibacteraeota bacterium]